MPSELKDIDALQRQIAALQAQLADAKGAAGSITQKIASGGGAAVQGPVEVYGGHFIGRDYLQFITHVVQSGEDPEEVKSVIAHYLGALAADLAGLKLGEIDTSVDQTKMSPLELADIYVPLDTTLRIAQEATLAEWLALEQSSPRDVSCAEREMRSVYALEALADHRELTLLGKPGSGKSTFGASVLLALAQAWQGHAEELAKLGETWKHNALLPIRVILRRFAEQLPAGDLWDFIGSELDAGAYGLSTDAIKYVQRIAREHGALILFDGLDECGETGCIEQARSITWD